ncbi:retrovirus-related pol polyprotein from transposon TNT 1-94 [Tanacetum coccineum]
MQMVGGNGGNQFRQYAGQNVGNLNGYNAAQNVGNLNANQNGNGNVVAAQAEGNGNGNNENQVRCYNCRGLCHYARNCIARPRRRDTAYLQTQLLIAQKEEAEIQLQAEEFDLMATGDIDEIEEENANYILMANLQQASTSCTQTNNASVYDSDGSADHEPPVVYDLEETLQLAEDSRLKMKQLKKEIKLANYAKINHLSGVFVSQTAKLREELYFSNTSKTDTVSKSISIPNEEFSDDTSPSVAQKFLNEALEFEIEHLLRVVVSQDIMSIVQNPTVVETFNLQTELKHTKERFENCIIKKENEYAKLWNDWINHFKTSREENYVPNKPINSSVRTNPITISQPHVLTKKDVNSNSNGLSFKGLDITTKTRRPQPRRNTKNDRVPSASMSSCIKNKEVEVEEHHRNLMLSKNKKHMSSECYPNLFMARRLGLFQAYDWESKASHQFRLEVFGNYLEIAFRRNTCFVRNLEGGDLLKGNHTLNLYTINLHEMASTSLIFLMARANSTKSWLWHQHLSYLNFDTINDLAKNDLVTGLPKFKYHKEHLCPSYKQGKSKKASHPPKPVPNSKQRLHLLHMDLCCPIRVESINRKRHVVVIVDD